MGKCDREPGQKCKKVHLTHSSCSRPRGTTLNWASIKRLNHSDVLSSWGVCYSDRASSNTHTHTQTIERALRLEQGNHYATKKKKNLASIPRNLNVTSGIFKTMHIYIFKSIYTSILVDFFHNRWVTFSHPGLGIVLGLVRRYWKQKLKHNHLCVDFSLCHILSPQLI